MTKCHKLGGLGNRHLFSTVLGWESKTKAPTDSVFGKGSPGLKTVVILSFHCFHMAEGQGNMGVGAGRGRILKI
jgi:hypothetical protein